MIEKNIELLDEEEIVLNVPVSSTENNIISFIFFKNNEELDISKFKTCTMALDLDNGSKVGFSGSRNSKNKNVLNITVPISFTSEPKKYTGEIRLINDNLKNINKKLIFEVKEV